MQVFNNRKNSQMYKKISLKMKECNSYTPHYLCIIPPTRINVCLRCSRVYAHNERSEVK